MELDISYGGDEIANDKRDNVQECAKWAASESANFWTYNRDTGECALKSSSERNLALNHVSGSSGCADRVDDGIDDGSG